MAFKQKARRPSRRGGSRGKVGKRKVRGPKPPPPPPVEIDPSSPIQVGRLAEAMGEKPATIVGHLMTKLGVFATVTQSIDPTTATQVRRARERSGRGRGSSGVVGRRSEEGALSGVVGQRRTTARSRAWRADATAPRLGRPPPSALRARRPRVSLRAQHRCAPRKSAPPLPPPSLVARRPELRAGGTVANNSFDADGEDGDGNRF